MRLTRRHHLIQTTVATILALSIALPPQAHAADEAKREVVVSTYRDPQTSVLYQNTVVASSPEELKAERPSELRKNPGLRAIWQANNEVAKATVKNFPADAAVFVSAMGFVALRQLITDYPDHPDAIYNLITHQVLDPFAAASFLVFSYGNHAGSAVYQAAAERMGLLRDEARFAQVMQELTKKAAEMGPMREATWYRVRAEAERLVPTPKTQGFITAGKRSFGLAAGVLLSGIMSEFASDRNVRVCTKSWFLSPKEQLKLIAQEKLSPIEACDKAWETWMSTGKLVDHLPDVASMVATFLTQGFVLPPTARVLARPVTIATERYIPILLRGVQLARVAGSRAPVPVVRVASFVAHAYVFLELNSIFLPLIQEPFEGTRQSKKLIRLETEIKRNRFTPALPSACEKDLEENIPAETLAKATMNAKLLWLKGVEANCGELPQTYPQLVSRFSETMSKWRAFWLRDAQSTVSSWQNHIHRVQGRYNASYQFYRELISRLNNGNPADEINAPTPFNGLVKDSTDADATSEAADRIVDAIQFIDERITALEQVIQDKEKKKDKAKPSELEALRWYRTLAEHFEALDSQSDTGRKLKTRAEREARFAEGVELLQRLNLQHPLFSIYATPGIKDIYGFKTLQSKLGQIHPLGAGVAAIKRWNSEPAIISPLTLKLNDQSIGNARTPTMSEWLLASMVCGPKAETNTLADKPSAVVGLKETFGFPATFIPPRVITIDQDLCALRCEKRDIKGGCTFDIHQAKFTDIGLKERGFLEIVRAHLRPEFRGPNGVKNFDDYWKSRVEPEVQTALSRWGHHYAKAMAKTILPKLTSDDKKRAYLEENREFHYVEYEKGILPSMQQEFEVYAKGLKAITGEAGEKPLATIRESFDSLLLLVANPSTSNKLTTELEQSSLDAMTKLAGGSDKNVSELQADPAFRLQLLNMALNAKIEDALANVLAAIPKNTGPDVPESAVALVEGLMKLTNEARSLGLVHTVIEIEGLKSEVY